jgi:hypothetical protein
MPFSASQAAEIAGIRAIVVHALGETAKRFYEKHGFSASPIDPLTVVLSLSDAERILSPE